MASEFLQKQRGRFSSFLDQEFVRPVRKTYQWLETQAIGYLTLIGDKLMAARRVDAQPDPRMTQAQREAQQRLIQEGLARSRRDTEIDLLIASGVLVSALVIGYLGLMEEQTGTSANIDSQGDNRSSITAPAPAEAVEASAAATLPPPAYYISFPPTATFEPTLIFTETPTFEPTGTATATLSPEEARLAEIERTVARFDIPADHKEFFPNIGMLGAGRLRPGNKMKDSWLAAGFQPYIVGDPWVEKNSAGDDIVVATGVFQTDAGEKVSVRVAFGTDLAVMNRALKPRYVMHDVNDIIDHLRDIQSEERQISLGFPAFHFEARIIDNTSTDSCNVPTIRSCGRLYDDFIGSQERELAEFAQFHFPLGADFTLPTLWLIELEN